ncbi:S8 family serine peptidase [Cellulomonas carbonis]|nr:S8 family serine peptidase [Cellulomonas carbonis]GGC00843.1 hypothetical protein GCM10010972_12040 [Cellulomonas carbonis]
MTPMKDLSGGATARRRACTGIAALSLVVAATVPAAAADGDRVLGTAADYGVPSPAESGELTSEFATSPTGAWFVELAPEPTAQGGSRAAVLRAERDFAAEAAGEGVEVEVRRTFSTLWSGVSAEIADEDVEAVRSLPSVQAVYPVLAIDAPAPSSASPDLATALAMSGADVAQSELGLTGEGVKVGIIDTGVDIDHPDLGGGGTDDGTAFPSARVVAGYDFVGDTYNADPTSDAYQPVPQPDENPDDCQGHGTHVAGIVGADGDIAAGGVRGVAPGVTLGAYRVFGCDGSTESDIMIAAMERALADGMDVVNQSIGAAFQTWPGYPTAVASDNLVDAGVVMVASIGNSGASGTWSAGAPGVGEDVIGVASYDNTHVTAQVVQVDGQDYPFLPATGAPEPPTTGSLDLVALGAPGTDAARACEPIDPAVADGKAVLVERGAAVTPGVTCDATFYAKALRAQQAGAAAVVLYNNVPGLFSPTVAGAEPITIPVIAVSATHGAELTAATADGATLTWTDEVGRAVNPTGGLISSFSSYGMAADLSLKPDLGAPGGNIFATYPLEKGGYATLSGTSMAAPHVAGAVALLLEARPDTEAHEVRSILQNHADPSDWSLAAGNGYVEPVHRQGAGMLDIDAAILATTAVTPGKLSLGESEHGPVEATLTVTNDGDADVTYATSVVDTIATSGNPDVPTFLLGGTTVEMPETVTVPAGGSADLTVSIAPDAELEAELAQYGGFVVLTPEEGEALSVPFAGFAGDYQDLELFGTFNGLELPALAELTACDRLIGTDCVSGGAWDLVDPGHVFTMRDGDVPSVVFHMEHPAESITMRVLLVLPGRLGAIPLGRSVAYEEEFVGRDSGGISVRTWDGTIAVGKGKHKVPLPGGRYMLQVTAVNALGDASDPEHRETWTSPAFTIDRKTPRS